MMLADVERHEPTRPDKCRPIVSARVPWTSALRVHGAFTHGGYTRTKCERSITVLFLSPSVVRALASRVAGREVGTRYGEGCLRERKKERKKEGDTAEQSEGNGRVQHNDQTRGLKWVVCRCADIYPLGYSFPAVVCLQEG